MVKVSPIGINWLLCVRSGTQDSALLLDRRYGTGDTQRHVAAADTNTEE